MSCVLQESTATSEPRWGGKRSSAAGRKAPVTSRRCLTSKGKWDRKYYIQLKIKADEHSVCTQDGWVQCQFIFSMQHEIEKHCKMQKSLD